MVWLRGNIMDFLNKTTTNPTTPYPAEVPLNPMTTSSSIRDTEEIFVDPISLGAIQLSFCVLYATVFVLGVFGNALVCYVVLRNRAMQTVTNIFITNLALSDILLCLLAVPFTPMYTFLRRWAFGETLCHIMPFAQGCSIYISTLTLTSIAIDRYFVIIYPFKPRMKLSTCITIIIAIWLVALLATLPYGFYMKIEKVSFAGNTTILNNEYMSNLTGTTTLAPTVLFRNFSEQVATNPLTEDPDVIYYCEENWPSEEYRLVFCSINNMFH